MPYLFPDCIDVLPVVTPGTANRRTTGGLTLFEIAISLAILASVVTTVFLALTAGLKAQQSTRLHMHASVRMMTMIEAWAQNPTRQLLATESAEMGELGTDFQFDLERHLLLHAKRTGGNNVQRFWYEGWAGVGVLPPAIAARLDSPGDEIAAIQRDGGQLYYFRPGVAGSERLFRTALTEDLRLGSESSKLIFGIRGKPQQNALRGHPTQAWPYYEYYPFPPQPWHRRNWAWNLDFQSPNTLPTPGVTGVVAIEVTARGEGFARAPLVEIAAPGSGRQARARAIVNLGRVTAIQVIDPGHGYAGMPVVTLTAVDGGTGATAEASTGPVTMAMVDYAAAEPATAAHGLARWRSRHPTIDWNQADAAFHALYDYCHHFLTPGENISVTVSTTYPVPSNTPAPAAPPPVTVGVTPQQTWVDAPYRKRWRNFEHINNRTPFDRLENYQHSTNPSQTQMLNRDEWRDPVKRFSHAGYWLTQVRPLGADIRQVNAMPVGVNSDPFFQVIDLATTNYDNPEPTTGGEGALGERARCRQFLHLAQDLVRALLPDDPIGGTVIGYESVDYGFNVDQPWPLPHPPKSYPDPGGGGWDPNDEHLYPPSFKILAISYLAYAAHVAATRVTADAANWDQTQGVTAITVTAPGGGYTESPRVIVSGGGGWGCIAVAEVTAGAVTEIIVLDPGSAYTSSPTVTLVDGGGAGATATAAIGAKWGGTRIADERSKLALYARALEEICQAWAVRYASSDPYDWGAPRPVNRQIAWDFPLLHGDLFPSGPMRPDPAIRAGLPYFATNYGGSWQPNSGDLDLDLGAAVAPRSLYPRIGPTLVDRWTTARNSPAWRRGRLGDDATARSDIDRVWKVVAERQPRNWGPANGLRHINSGGRISQQNLPPGTPGDYDNTSDLWYSWSDHARFHLTAPFHPAERCREIVVWSVDWQGYEDFETALEPEFDARSFSSPSVQATVPHSDLSWSSRTDAAYDYGGGGVSGEGLWGYRHPHPLDRNGNNLPTMNLTASGDGALINQHDAGPLPASTRLRATVITRFVYYDGRLIGSLRQ